MSFLEGLEKKGILLGLERMQKALQVLGNPQESFESILIGGTNGKGSTSAFLSRLLIENRYKTGFYSSPHINRFNERILVNGKEISNNTFAKQVTELKKISEENELELTQFEFLTCACLRFFAKQKIEIAVLEVGLGGRLDATNTVSPIASAITNIGLEHQEFLGKTIREIALEKAGIIKEKTVFVSTEKNPEILRLFQDIALGKQALFFQSEKDFVSEAKTVSAEKTIMHFKGFGIELDGIDLGLHGRHQAKNAGLAVALLAALKQQNKIRLNKKSILIALKKTRWPGRFQIISKKPLVILDACHNPSGCRALAETIKESFPGKKLTIVFGASDDKDAEEMLKEILPLAEKLVLCRAKCRGKPAEELQEISKKMFPGFKISVIPDVKKAVTETVKQARKQEGILVCGSLFVIRESLKSLNKL